MSTNFSKYWVERSGNHVIVNGLNGSETVVVIFSHGGSEQKHTLRLEDALRLGQYLTQAAMWVVSGDTDD